MSYQKKALEARKRANTRTLLRGLTALPRRNAMVRRTRWQRSPTFNSSNTAWRRSRSTGHVKPAARTARCRDWREMSISQRSTTGAQISVEVPKPHQFDAATC